jgi:hypothetical protein
MPVSGGKPINDVGNPSDEVRGQAQVKADRLLNGARSFRHLQIRALRCFLQFRKGGISQILELPCSFLALLESVGPKLLDELAPGVRGRPELGGMRRVPAWRK